MNNGRAGVSGSAGVPGGVPGFSDLRLESYQRDDVEIGDLDAGRVIGYLVNLLDMDVVVFFF